MIEFLMAAPASGSGKTALTCAMLEALRRRGLNPCAFKCGPDYIDPMFHRSVLEVDSHNLDLFLAEPEQVEKLYARYAQGHGASVVEGVMGFYDGLGGSTPEASAWHLADTLNLPVVLVLRPKGASLTLAAQVKGLLTFRRESHIMGIILNDCSPMLHKSLAPMLERETGLPVLGYLPHMEEARFESRHLGLLTAGEIGDLKQRIAALATQLEQSVDLDRLFALCTGEINRDLTTKAQPREKKAVIAVASDEAFCFLYAETLDALREAGAELWYFSPLKDEKLPEDIGGLYLPGGYPELYAESLSRNTSMLRSIAQRVQEGLPTVAECGGFLYLGKTLEGEDGKDLPLAGVLPGEGKRQKRLVRFGYARLTAKEDSLLFRAGEEIPIHEFHYWDSTENGEAFEARKPVTGRSWECGFATPTLYAGFPHLYFAGNPRLAQRFADAAAQYQEKQKGD